MASNITSSAVFTLTNMKPDPNEQIDAIQAQNAADNGGYVYFRHQQGPCFQAIGRSGASSGTFYFRKTAAYGTMTGTVVGTYHPGGNDSAIAVRVDGTTVFNHTFFPGTAFKVGFGTSISHLANDTNYELTYSWGMDQINSNNRMNVTTFLVP